MHSYDPYFRNPHNKILRSIRYNWEIHKFAWSYKSVVIEWDY